MDINDKTLKQSTDQINTLFAKRIPAVWFIEEKCLHLVYQKWSAHTMKIGHANDAGKDKILYDACVYAWNSQNK